MCVRRSDAGSDFADQDDAGRDCLGKYESLKGVVRELGNILEDLEGIARQHQLNDPRRREFYDRATHCRDVLQELQREVDTFQSLDGPTRRLADRVRWDDARVNELQQRFSASVTMLNSFYQLMSKSPQIKIESALIKLLEEIQDGLRPPTLLSNLSTVQDDSDEAAWPGIVKDLEGFGIPREASEEHRTYIVQWLSETRLEILPSHPTSETDASSHSNPTSVPDHPRRQGSSTTSYGQPLGQVITNQSNFQPDTLRYMNAFGDFGEETAADVKKSVNTFKEDVNRSREYWVRGNWAEVKRNLLRVMVAAQLPHHRRADIDARTSAFLLGVACSNSGDFEAAKLVFFSILEPFPRSGLPHDLGHCDDAQIAAATWLGDTCLKTNRVEDAALAWCIALDAVRRRDQEQAQARNRDGSLQPQPSPSMSPPISPPQPTRSKFTMRHPSVDMPSPPLSGPGVIQVGPSAQARILLSEIILVNRGTGNLHSLLEGVESGWYPHMADANGSVFADNALISADQMRMVVMRALEAAEQADDRTALMSLYKTHSGDAISQMVLCKRANILRSFSTRHRVEEMVSPDELLRSPTRRGAWPMLYDLEFSYLAAITALEYIHEHTALKEEGVSFNIPILDAKQSKQLVAEKGKPIYLAKDLQPKERKHVERFIEAVRITLSSMNFHVREAPAEFRCQPRTDYPHPRWASVASLSVRVIGFQPDGILAKRKLACYVSDIVHWDGRHDSQHSSDLDSSELVKEMYYTLAIRHEADRGKSCVRPTC